MPIDQPVSAPSSRIKDEGDLLGFVSRAIAATLAAVTILVWTAPIHAEAAQKHCGYGLNEANAPRSPHFPPFFALCRTKASSIEWDLVSVESFFASSASSQ